MRSDLERKIDEKNGIVHVTIGDGGVTALFGAAHANPLMHAVSLSDVGLRHKGVPSALNGKITHLCLAYNALGARGARDTRESRSRRAAPRSMPPARSTARRR